MSEKEMHIRRDILGFNCIKLTYLAGILLMLLLFSCDRENSRIGDKGIVSRDLEQIRERGKLVALTDYNSISYFIYKGEPMGFQFELLREFADYLQIELEIVTENDLSLSFEMLDDGRIDLMALSLTVNNERKERVKFSSPISQTRQVLVQKRPDNWRQMTMDEIDDILVRSLLELSDRTVYVQSESSYAQRMKNLQSEIGDTIHIVEVPMEVEELIKLVADGEINFTVSDENIAMVNRTYYPDIDLKTPVSFEQNLAWAVRKSGSDELLAELNSWIEGFRNTRSYALIYAKYFKNSRSKHIVKSDYYSLGEGKISRWDEYFRKYSDSINWDWRLLASLVLQESRFEPDVRSWAGAYGLMQLMPSTGRQFGIDVYSSPENNIRAGVKYIDWLQDMFEDKVADENERLKFILAAYNVGPGHVLDARQLARKYGRDPEVWDNNVAYYLLRKSDPEFYHDPVVEHGFCRGEEPYNYVIEVLDRYEHYANFLDDK
ncbi:MAG: transporter substrate-binding domain-containing protein [Bacteroidales bacterium]|nr:transporter substrate-binding domain-containing protein [Bacteroidales bacterium]